MATDAVTTSAVDHGQVVLAVGRRTADHPGLGVHGKEPRCCDIDVQREFRTQGGGPPEHSEALEQLQLGLGILHDGRGQFVEHLANESPRFERCRRCCRCLHWISP